MAGCPISPHPLDDAGSPNQADELVATEYRPLVNCDVFPKDALLSITFYAGDITARAVLATVVTERKIEKENSDLPAFTSIKVHCD